MKHLILIVMLLCGWALPLQAEDKTATPAAKGIGSYLVIEKLPVLDNGRIKPLDTYARSTLLQFSGRQSFHRKPAIDWLSRLLFAPDDTKNDKVFLINNPAIAESLGIKPEPHRKYSFAQIEPLLDKLSQLAQAAYNIPDKERDVMEAELIRVFNNIKLYIDLSHVFQFAFPAKDFTINDQGIKTELGLPQDQQQFSFLDIASSVEHLQPLIDVIQKKSESSWTAQDHIVLELVSNLYQWSGVYQDLPLNIIPDQEKPEIWRSPWDSIRHDFQNELTRQEMGYLSNMTEAYWQGDQLSFDLNTKLLIETVKQRSGKKPETIMKKMAIETFYNKSDFFLYSKMLYLLAFILFLFSLASDRKWLYKAAFGCISLGFVPHLIGIILRIIILERPPVSTLYETFIFVSFVIVLLGLLIEFFSRNWLGIVTSGVGGFIVLMIAAKYSAEGDTMKMLIAVLNSNFWLSTHVISITAGYGSACAAGIIGHVYLLQKVFGKNKKVLDSTFNTLLGILGLALTLTFLGTNLGGIWADQSWGRFWGWDPKENGALMIVLWTAMLFHARIARWVGEIGMAVGAVLGTIVVVWAWFGVNLLSIGLHSYGFTSGVAMWVSIYVGVELLFIAVVMGLIYQKRSKQS